MKTRIILLAFFAIGLSLLDAQTDEERIKQVIEKETTSWAKGDYEAWKSTWIHDESASHMVPFTGFEHSGWENIDEWLRPTISERDISLGTNKLENSAYDIRIFKKHAWVTYVQKNTLKDETAISREVRLMEKVGKDWKIVSIVTMPQHSSDPSYISNNLYWSAHAFYSLGKIEEAKEVLQTGAKVCPEAYWFHTFLGELYSLEGKKNEAMEHVKHALSIAPDSQKGGIQEMMVKIEEK